MDINPRIFREYDVRGIVGRDLTPETLVAGMEKIQEWKPENLGARVTYAPDRHHGNNASRVAQAQDGKIIGLTPWTVFQPRF